MSKSHQAALPSAPAARAAGEGEDLSQLLCFDDNNLLPELFGPQAQRLKRLAQTYGVDLDHRGNAVVCRGERVACERARDHLLTLYARLKSCERLSDEEGSYPHDPLLYDSLPHDPLPPCSSAPDTLPQATARSASQASTETLAPVASSAISFVTSWGLDFPKARIVPRNGKQETFLRALSEHPLVFATGPAGTGKTCIALGYGVSLLRRGDVERLILSRPVVEAGESLGFLPGDMREKVDPYLRPIFDLLHRWLGKSATERCLAQGTIEIAPLSFMRGRTIENAFLLLDEAQNTSPEQMKMVLTRLGTGARIAVTGDPSQADLLPASRSNGLCDAERRLVHIAPFVRFSPKEVVRHPLVAKVLRAYEHSCENEKQTDEKPIMERKGQDDNAFAARRNRNKP